MKKELHLAATDLLRQLIAVPSFSREENETAAIIRDFFSDKKIPVKQSGNNIVVCNLHYNESKPTILLNSHHDTVKPGADWTKDPFLPQIENEKLFGLGSNDAGASLVSLIACFLHFYSNENLPVNFVLAATAEEEISGANGIASILSLIGKIDFAIIGEPTKMQMAIAEKGLLVLDCIAHGKTGHAARNEGENAIYKAMNDIAWFRSYRFPEISEWLGEVKMTVTTIEAGKQHNIVPETCRFTVDIRLTEKYSPEEIIQIIGEHISAELKPRSLRLRPSSISESHPFVQSGKSLGLAAFGSPTLSDQALIPFPSVKIGPGDSARSHTADEFIFLHEIENGIELYIRLLENYFITVQQKFK